MLTGAKATSATIYNSDFYSNTPLICYVLGYKQTTDMEVHTGLLNSTLRTRKRNERKCNKSRTSLLVILTP